MAKKNEQKRGVLVPGERPGSLVYEKDKDGVWSYRIVGAQPKAIAPWGSRLWLVRQLNSAREYANAAQTYADCLCLEKNDWQRHALSADRSLAKLRPGRFEAPCHGVIGVLAIVAAIANHNPAFVILALYAGVVGIKQAMRRGVS